MSAQWGCRDIHRSIAVHLPLSQTLTCSLLSLCTCACACYPHRDDRLYTCHSRIPSPVILPLFRPVGVQVLCLDRLCQHHAPQPLQRHSNLAEQFQVGGQLVE